MYNVLKQLEDGVFVKVASRDDLQQALHLAQSLNEHWPGNYEVRDSHSGVVGHPTSPGLLIQHHH
ncbi:MAG TPA: hypothetical protein VGI46_01630 [Candidatus Acidoferrum sp.]|jgi:hypothetical protein